MIVYNDRSFISLKVDRIRVYIILLRRLYVYTVRFPDNKTCQHNKKKNENFIAIGQTLISLLSRKLVAICLYNPTPITQARSAVKIKIYSTRLQIMPSELHQTYSHSQRRSHIYMYVFDCIKYKFHCARHIS